MSQKGDLQVLVSKLTTEEKEQLGEALVLSGLSKELTRKQYSAYFKALKVKSKGKLKDIFAILQNTPETRLDKGISTFLKIRTGNQ